MKRFFIALLIMLLVIGGVGTAVFFGLGIYLSPQSPLTKADAIVAISGGETATRTEEAVKLYQDGYAPAIIFSGAAADPNGPSNARAMASDAERLGVPASDIALDEASANTRENAANVAVIVRKSGYKSIILVTSPYHQRRAFIAFSRELGKGFPIVNHSSSDQRWRRSHWWATEYSQNLTFAEFQKVLFELASGQNQ